MRAEEARGSTSKPDGGGRSRARRSRGLRSVVSWCLVLIAASHVAVELAGLRFRQPQADETIQKLDVCMRWDRGPDIALVGSSRIRHGVTVRAFEDELARVTGRAVTAFNLGIDDGILSSSYVVARDVLAGARKPRLIVLGLGVRSFNSRNPVHDRTVAHLLSPLDLWTPIGPDWSRLDGARAAVEVLFRAPATLLFSWPIFWPSLRGFAETVEGLGGSYYAPATEVSEVVPAEVRREILDIVEGRRASRAEILVTLEKIPADVKKRVLDLVDSKVPTRVAYVRRKDLVAFDVEGRSTWAFERLADLCADRGIRLLVVNMPLVPEFEERAYEGEYETYLAHLTRLCDRRDIPFFDLNRLPYRPERYFFRDGDHLNVFGASLLARILARDVVAPLYEKWFPGDG